MHRQVLPLNKNEGKINAAILCRRHNSQSLSGTSDQEVELWFLSTNPIKLKLDWLENSHQNSLNRCRHDKNYLKWWKSFLKQIYLWFIHIWYDSGERVYDPYYSPPPEGSRVASASPSVTFLCTSVLCNSKLLGSHVLLPTVHSDILTLYSHWGPREAFLISILLGSPVI